MRTTSPETGTSSETVKQPASRTDTANRADIVQHKLDRAERALDSLSRILTLLPNPIEVVCSDYTILFTNHASRQLHDNERLDGTLYYETVMGLEEPPRECPILAAIENDSETTYTAACANNNVFEITVTPIELSDGRRAALCFSRPAITGGSSGIDPGVSAGIPHRADSSSPPGSSAARDDDEEKEILRRIAELSAGTLDAVLSQITDGVLLARKSGKPILYNSAFSKLTGFRESGLDRTEMPGGSAPPDPADTRSLPGILFPDRDTSTSEPAVFDDLVVDGETRHYETDIIDGDGERVPVKMSVSRIPGTEDAEAIVLVTIRDSRETLEVESQLLKSLNLAMAGERIATREGTITVKSRPGEGATFEIRLPVRSPVVSEDTFDSEDTADVTVDTTTPDSHPSGE